MQSGLENEIRRFKTREMPRKRNSRNRLTRREASTRKEAGQATETTSLLIKTD